MRSDAKAQEILDLHPAWKGKVAFVAIRDIVTPHAFDEVFKQNKHGFDYIIHTASPVKFDVTDFQKDLIDPAVQGQVCQPPVPGDHHANRIEKSTTGILKAAHEFGGPQIKRVVLLGSAVSVLDSFQDPSVAGTDYSEKDWNPVNPQKHEDKMLGPSF